MTSNLPYELFTIHIDRVYETSNLMVQVNCHIDNTVVIFDTAFNSTADGIVDLTSKIATVVEEKLKQTLFT